MVQVVRTLTILVASGASGGHLFPALAVAQELVAHGHAVTMVLGGKKFANIVRDAQLPMVHLPAAAFNDRGILGKGVAVFQLVRGLWVALRLMRRVRPDVVFGTGGYATVALVLVARLLGVPVVIHEQNVLPGRANRFLARLANVMLLTFEKTRTFLPPTRARVVVTGTPLRAEILAAAAAHTRHHVTPKTRPENQFTLLVLGGSQGSRILNDVACEAVALLTPDERRRLRVIQQARPEDLERTRAFYGTLGLHTVDVRSFFDDMPKCYVAADLMVARSGVGTVLEAAVFGLPALYVPLGLADGHQKWNAAVAEDVGAALVLPQALYTPANVLVQLRALWQNPNQRAAMATAALTLAQPDATQRVTQAVVAASGPLKPRPEPR